MSLDLHDWIYADWVSEQFVTEKWTAANEAEIDKKKKKYNKDSVRCGRRLKLFFIRLPRKAYAFRYLRDFIDICLEVRQCAKEEFTPAVTSINKVLRMHFVQRKWRVYFDADADWPIKIKWVCRFLLFIYVGATEVSPCKSIWIQKRRYSMTRLNTTDLYLTYR